MKRLSICFLAAAAASCALAQEAGYAIHVNSSGDVRRCILAPITRLTNVVWVGELEVSGLFELGTNANLGVGFGKSGRLADQARWQAGVSFLDAGGSTWEPELGVYVGLSWRF